MGFFGSVVKLTLRGDLAARCREAAAVRVLQDPAERRPVVIVEHIAVVIGQRAVAQIAEREFVQSGIGFENCPKRPAVEMIQPPVADEEQVFVRGVDGMIEALAPKARR